MVSSEKIIRRNRENAAARFIDMTGWVFNRLTVIQRVFKKSKCTHWLCKCICGNENIVDGRHLRGKKISSCGCLVLEINSKRMKENNIAVKTHGLTNHPLRAIWKSMLHRCYNKNNKFYKNYGGKGVNVCDTWKNSLQEFYDWSIVNGWRKGLSIDRINNDGDYNPLNCQWITKSENSRKNCVIGNLRKEKCARNNSSSQLQS